MIALFCLCIFAETNLMCVLFVCIYFPLASLSRSQFFLVCSFVCSPSSLIFILAFFVVYREWATLAIVSAWRLVL